MFNLTAVMGCPWRQAVHRAQLSVSSFCFFFWKERTKSKIRHDVITNIPVFVFFFPPEKAQEMQTKTEFTCRSHISVYVHTHPLPAQRDSLRYYDSQMVLCRTFFTCNNLLFRRGKAEFHLIILAIVEQRQLCEARGPSLHFIYSAFLSFNTLISP